MTLRMVQAMAETIEPGWTVSRDSLGRRWWAHPPWKLEGLVVEAETGEQLLQRIEWWRTARGFLLRLPALG